MEQRQIFMDTAGLALVKLDDAQRGRATYISKMIAAGGIGLFDASLNYLWDETVTELRKRVVNYDLEYFYSVAEKSDARRKELKTAEDLVKLDDSKLLNGAREIGLINEVGFRELDHIRYMRNYASAAHPNQVELDGLQLANWLNTCIRQAILLPDNVVVAAVKKLLINVKSKKMDDNGIRDTAVFLKNLSQAEAITLASGLFSTYTTTSSTPETLDNIRRLWPKLWEHVSEDARHNFGFRLGNFNASGDHEQAVLARQLIDLVDGTTYLPEEEREVEVNQALEELVQVHNEWNNFYNERPVARRLSDLVGQLGVVPKALTQKYVLNIVDVFLTNGHGIALAADPIYRDLIGKFDPEQASIALRSFTDSVISSKLQQEIPRQQWAVLLTIIEDKLTARPERELLDAIRKSDAKPHQLWMHSAIKRQLLQWSQGD
ncbi:hypothetical protein AVW11_04150 [Streptomyces amritsarensis]|uniref:Uncharacterized protein n=1 Tax=Streptomyces amritsarensis TaxID=681158 RepID=A0ABX3G9S2_9ACTN|nr:hypothetical protein AVW11_04150 [Streptomyces amritsarensis]